MKRLMTALAAVAGAIGLHAATTGTGFEIQLPDGASSTNYVDVLSDAADELGGGTSSLYWDLTGATLDENGLLVKAYGSETKYGGKQGETGSEKFPAPNSSANTNYLAISTSSGTAVTRYATSGGSSVAISKSFYFDSLVKFTAFETNKLADVVLTDGGKLAIWLQADDIDPETLEPTRTNLVVSAGYLTGGGASAYSAVATNYLCSVRDVNVADGEWHRVSVKAIDTINSDETVPGFVIAIDGKLVTITNNTDQYTGLADIGTIDSAKIPQRVKKFYQTSNGSPKNNLFPSVFATSEGLNASITSVSFAGVGSVDDLVFTEDNDVDALEDAADTGILTVNFGSYIEAAKYSIGGATPVSISNGDTVPYAGGTLEVTILDIEPTAGYLVSGVVGEDGAAVVDNGDGTYTVTVTADQKAITISADQAGAMVSGAAGDANKGYATAAEVFEAINGGIIAPATLGGTITVTLNMDIAESISLANGDVQVVLDLAGKTITGVPGLDGAINLDAGTLIITNTVGVGIVDAGTSDTPASLWVNGGNIEIRAGVYDGLVYVLDADSIVVSGGKFDIAAIEEAGDDETYLNPIANHVVPDGYELVAGTGADSGYYIVKEPSLDPIPPISPDATPAQVAEAIDEAGFADDNVAELIDGDAATYLSFKTWAGTAGSGTSSEREAAVVASTNAVVSYKLKDVVALPTLFENYPDIDFSAVLQNGDSWNVTLHLKDGESTVALNALIAGYIGKVFKGIAPNAVTTACTLEDVTNASVDGVGRVTLTIAPPDPDKGFFKFKAD